MARCLDALARGLIAPDEVVVVNQGSDDRTKLLAEAARDAFPRLVYDRDGGSGLGGQNRGFRLASSSIVAVTDDDCVPEPDWLEVIRETFRTRPDLGAVTGRVLPLPASGDEAYAVASRVSGEPREFMGPCLPWEVGSGNNFALRTEWAGRIRGCDERLGPGAPGLGAVDIDLFHRLLRAGAGIRYEPRSLVFHQRQTRHGRRSRRFPYGHGMGAAAVYWSAQGDRAGLRLLAAWTWWRTRRLLRAAVRLDAEAALEEALMLGGTARGVVHALARVLPIGGPRARAHG